MKMNITKQQLAPPYRPQDLMFLRTFIGFCRDNGVVTEEPELEYYEKERLLIPALRVRYGYLPMKKILAVFQEGKEPEWRHVYEDTVGEFDTLEVDPKVYYMHGGISKMNQQKRQKSKDFLDQLRDIGLISVYGPDWIEDYRKLNLVVQPELTVFRPWSTYKMGPTFSTRKKDFVNAQATLYSPLQIYTLRYIQNRRSIKIKDAALFRSPESWSESGRRITHIFTEAHSNEAIRQGIIEQQKFHNLANQILTLYEHRDAFLLERIHELEQQHQKTLDEQEAHKEAIDEINDELSGIEERYKPLLEKLLTEHGVTISYLLDNMHSLLDISTFSRLRLPSDVRQSYLREIEAGTLLKEYPNKIAHQLMWALYVLDPKKYKGIGIKSFLTNSHADRCVICHSTFEKSRKDQKTCGNPQCKREYNTQSVATGRRKGIY